ncbi:glycoside hydrolase family 3 C-terminal domain-containing protein [Paenibacillus sp. YIM B09110]|uniref:glycoside hydrolase family 3 C-terminal domain-containing protein n=1 Tax=Paenibacillus sp. YIM B09110 TaxID=3126102 RepID=UPI00301DD830
MKVFGYRTWSKKAMPVVLACSLSIGLLTGTMPTGVVNAAEGELVAFKTQEGGVFDGMPLFDGVPEHLDAFVDAYFQYTGLEGPAVYATGSRNHYTLQQGENAGNKIPGALSAADNVQGISTDFPALVGMGQTWNKELLADIGQVIGAEKISQLKVKQGLSNIHGGSESSASVAFTVVSDLRINPLSGRFDEGFAEDAYLSGTMIDEMAAGLSGTDQEASEDGFWMRAAVGTKHYSVYNAQWFRQSASNSAGARAIYEYQTRAPLQAFESGSVAGVMTSFGRTNGIPNILSPIQLHANNFSKYGVYSSPDFNGDSLVFGANTMGNGYDTKYAQDRTLANLLMILAEANAGRPSPNANDALADVLAVVSAVEQGKYDVTAEDLIEAARPHVNQMVRIGIFNETDENGIPKYYPFAQDAKDVRTEAPATYALQEHQDVALRAAQESIVLLKNDGALPLAKEQKAAVSGPYADARFKTVYSVGTTPSIPNSGDSPLLAIIKQNGSDNVNYDEGGKLIALQSVLNGQTVTASTYGGEAGAGLVTTEDQLDIENNAHLFRVYDWGQEGVSLQSLLNGKWITSPSAANAVVGNTDATQLNLTNNDWNLAEMLGSTSTIPARLRMETNGDDTVSIVSNGYRTGFSGDFSNWYYTNGRFIRTAEDNTLKTTATTLTNATVAASRGDDVKFEQTVVKDVGEEAAARAATDDYAIVFVGAIPRHSAGEGNDRSSLYMGNDDYKLVEKVSAAFAAEGKKTVVVVKSSFPVVMEDIQNNPNVSAIVYQPYGGQYDSQALAQVLYGDYSPTGRLTSTWYSDMSAFPAINNYAIPEGNTTQTIEANTDPRFTVDMTNADPIESKLTYMYTDAPVTYSFGYGLSYSDFTYSDLAVPSSVSGSEPFTVSVTVENTGAVDTSEVVQLYANNNDAAYGEYAPVKQLVSYEKIELDAGESKTVELTVNPKDFAVWDVNKGDFQVESGSYSFMAGSASDDIRLEASVEVVGTPLAQLDIYEPFNVFDHSFASDEVIYHEVSKARTASSLKEKKVVGEYYSVRSKQNGSWTAIPKVDLTGAKRVTASVASDSEGGFITLHADSPYSAPIALLEVGYTGPTSYTIETAGVAVSELGYTDVTVDLSNTAITGIHDLYVVFRSPDLRIDSLSFQTDAVISVSGKIKGSERNPSLNVQADQTPFGLNAVNTDNWSFDGGDSGLTLSTVTLNEDQTVAKLQLAGTAKAKSTLQISALSEAFAGSTTGSNIVTVTVGSNSGSGTVTPSPEPEPGTEQPEEPEVESVKVSALTEADLALVNELKIPGVSVAGTPVRLSVISKKGLYAHGKLAGSTAAFTALARLNDDGTLTPVPTRVITNADGTRSMEALVLSDGIYVPINVERQFIDVPADAWYAEEIRQASSLLLLNGVSADRMQPTALTTYYQTLMVALNVLGVTPSKQSQDTKWYDSVLREAALLQLSATAVPSADSSINREQTAAILTKALAAAGLETTMTEEEATELLKSFVDASSITSEYRLSLAVMVKYGILKGTASGKLLPSAGLTRAELAAVALRARTAIESILSIE